MWGSYQGPQVSTVQTKNVNMMFGWLTIDVDTVKINVSLNEQQNGQGWQFYPPIASPPLQLG